MKKIIFGAVLVAALGLAGLYSFHVPDPTEKDYFPGPHSFVNGRTEEVRLVQARIKGANLDVPAVPYSYSVGPTEFRGQLLILDERADSIELLRRRFPAGSTIKVGYQIRSPEKSFAETKSIVAQQGGPADALSGRR